MSNIQPGAVWMPHDLAHLGFFFSSRRRHTRSKRDWSSDVCSSDLSGDSRGNMPATTDRSKSQRPRATRCTAATREKIGRASCRERVEIAEVAGSVERKKM